MTKKKILYVEDDQTLAFLTKDNLESFYHVHHCEDGQKALELFLEQPFDLCLLDMMLPKLNGFELIKEIRLRDKQIPIIILSAKTLKEDRIKGLKLGADDYLVKPYSIEELVLKIKVFLGRPNKITNQIKDLTYKIGDFTFHPEKFTISSPNKTPIRLTEREVELLKLLIEHKDTVIKRSDILMKLWGDDDYYASRSLDVFISRLRKVFKQNPNIIIENIPRIGFSLHVN